MIAVALDFRSDINVGGVPEVYVEYFVTRKNMVVKLVKVTLKMRLGPRRGIVMQNILMLS
jgi:hypothetical protein